MQENYSPRRIWLTLLRTSFFRKLTYCLSLTFALLLTHATSAAALDLTAMGIPTDSAFALISPALLAAAFLVCLLRFFQERAQWQMWTLFAIAILACPLFLQSTLANIAPFMSALLPGLTTGIALIIFPHIIRHVLNISLLSSVTDKMFLALSLVGAILTVMLFMPGLESLAPQLPLWGFAFLLFTLPVLRAAMLQVRGSTLFLFACLLPVVGSLSYLLLHEQLAEQNWVSMMPTWGIFASFLLIAALAPTTHHYSSAGSARGRAGNETAWSAASQTMFEVKSDDTMPPLEETGDVHAAENPFTSLAAANAEPEQESMEASEFANPFDVDDPFSSVMDSSTATTSHSPTTQAHATPKAQKTSPAATPAAATILATPSTPIAAAPEPAATASSTAPSDDTLASQQDTTVATSAPQAAEDSFVDLSQTTDDPFAGANEDPFASDTSAFGMPPSQAPAAAKPQADTGTVKEKKTQSQGRIPVPAPAPQDLTVSMDFLSNSRPLPTPQAAPQETEQSAPPASPQIAGDGFMDLPLSFDLMADMGLQTTSEAATVPLATAAPEKTDDSEHGPALQAASSGLDTPIALPLQNEVFNLRQAIEELFEQFSSTAAAKGVSLQLDMQAQLARLFDGPIAGLSRLLSLLIQNALEHTEQGVVSVTVHTSNDGVQFTIADTGAVSLKERGVLELCAAWESVGIFSDTLQSSFSPTQGASLSFTTQLSPITGTELETSDPTIRAPQHAPLSELILVGMREGRHALRGMLTSLHVPLHEAPSPAEALSMYKQSHAPLVIFNNDLPVSDLSGIIATIRAYETSEGLNPTTILGISPQSALNDALLNAGCSTVLVAPVMETVIQTTVREILGLPAAATEYIGEAFPAINVHEPTFATPAPIQEDIAPLDAEERLSYKEALKRALAEKSGTAMPMPEAATEEPGLIFDPEPYTIPSDAHSMSITSLVATDALEDTTSNFLANIGVVDAPSPIDPESDFAMDLGLDLNAIPPFAATTANDTPAVTTSDVFSEFAPPIATSTSDTLLTDSTAAMETSSVAPYSVEESFPFEINFKEDAVTDNDASSAASEAAKNALDAFFADKVEDSAPHTGSVSDVGFSGFDTAPSPTHSKVNQIAGFDPEELFGTTIAAGSRPETANMAASTSAATAHFADFFSETDTAAHDTMTALAADSASEISASEAFTAPALENNSPSNVDVTLFDFPAAPTSTTPDTATIATMSEDTMPHFMQDVMQDFSEAASTVTAPAPEYPVAASPLAESSLASALDVPLFALPTIEEPQESEEEIHSLFADLLAAKGTFTETPIGATAAETPDIPASAVVSEDTMPHFMQDAMQDFSGAASTVTAPAPEYPVAASPLAESSLASALDVPLFALPTIEEPQESEEEIHSLFADLLAAKGTFTETPIGATAAETPDIPASAVVSEDTMPHFMQDAMQDFSGAASTVTAPAPEYPVAASPFAESSLASALDVPLFALPTIEEPQESEEEIHSLFADLLAAKGTFTETPIGATAAGTPDIPASAVVSEEAMPNFMQDVMQDFSEAASTVTAPAPEYPVAASPLAESSLASALDVPLFALPTIEEPQESEEEIHSLFADLLAAKGAFTETPIGATAAGTPDIPASAVVSEEAMPNFMQDAVQGFSEAASTVTAQAMDSPLSGGRQMPMESQETPRGSTAPIQEKTPTTKTASDGWVDSVLNDGKQNMYARDLTQQQMRQAKQAAPSSFFELPPETPVTKTPDLDSGLVFHPDTPRVDVVAEDSFLHIFNDKKEGHAPKVPSEAGDSSDPISATAPAADTAVMSDTLVFELDDATMQTASSIDLLVATTAKEKAVTPAPAMPAPVAKTASAPILEPVMEPVLAEPAIENLNTASVSAQNLTKHAVLSSLQHYNKAKQAATPVQQEQPASRGMPRHPASTAPIKETTTAATSLSLGLGKEQVDSSLAPQIPEMVQALNASCLEAAQGRDTFNTPQVREAVAKMAVHAHAFGLTKLERMARCVERAAAAGDMEAVQDLFGELENVAARYQTALETAYRSHVGRALRP